MDVRVARPAVRRVFEVMMLQVRHCMRHVRLSRCERARPNRFAVPQNSHPAVRVIEFAIDDQFRANRARPQLGRGQIEIILLLHFMVGEFIA